MKQLPLDYYRCKPTKCKHNKENCARYTSPGGPHTPYMDVSKHSTGERCAGYEPNK